MTMKVLHEDHDARGWGFTLIYDTTARRLAWGSFANIILNPREWANRLRAAATAIDKACDALEAEGVLKK